jgi:cytochrome c
MKTTEVNEQSSGWCEAPVRKLLCRTTTLKLMFYLGCSLCICLASIPSVAAPNAQAGRTFARVNCSKCHSIDHFTPSSLAIAPPFRTLHEKYPVESLEEALAEGIVTGHPSMPEFRLDPGQIADFIVFLKTLK